MVVVVVVCEVSTKRRAPSRSAPNPKKGKRERRVNIKTGDKRQASVDGLDAMTDVLG